MSEEIVLPADVRTLTARSKSALFNPKAWVEGYEQVLTMLWDSQAAPANVHVVGTRPAQS